STEKSWPHFRPPPVDFCSSRLAIGAGTERARALAMPAAQALQTRANSSGVAPASPQVADREPFGPRQPAAESSVLDGVAAWQGSAVIISRLIGREPVVENYLANLPANTDLRTLAEWSNRKIAPLKTEIAELRGQVTALLTLMGQRGVSAPQTGDVVDLPENFLRNGGPNGPTYPRALPRRSRARRHQRHPRRSACRPLRNAVRVGRLEARSRRDARRARTTSPTPLRRARPPEGRGRARRALPRARDRTRTSSRT